MFVYVKFIDSDFKGNVSNLILKMNSDLNAGSSPGWQKKNILSEPKLNIIWILSTSIVDIKIFELILTINDPLTLSQKTGITST